MTSNKAKLMEDDLKQNKIKGRLPPKKWKMTSKNKIKYDIKKMEDELKNMEDNLKKGKTTSKKKK
jgi:hypothetical protein